MNFFFDFIVFFFVSVLLFSACGNESSSSPSVENMENVTQENTNPDLITITTSQFEAVQMELGNLEEADFSAIVKANGMLDVPPYGKAAVSAYIGGYVQGINLIPGQKVNKGQVLFKLENPEYIQLQQDYLEAKQQLMYLKTEADRQKILSDENIGAKKNYLKAESEYQVTRTRSEAIKKKLSLIKINSNNINVENLRTSISISAPISGYITAVNAKKGMFLTPTDVAIEITNIDHLHLELNVFEKDVLKLKKGQSINFRIPDSSTETFQAEVHLINKMVNEEKRTINVHGHLKNENNQNHFVPGMYVEAEIATNNVQAKALPESAIVTVDDQSFVLVLKNKTDGIFEFEKREVQVGLPTNGMIEIKNGSVFSTQEKILVKGGFNLIAEE